MAEITYRMAFASAPFTPSADWASSLGAQVTPYLPYCAPCLRHIPAGQADSSVSPGTVVYLPAEKTVPRDSIVRHQAAVNAGAYAHPGLALPESRCGHLVFVAPVTSFDGAGIQAKYNRIGAASKNNIFWRYLALESHLPPSPHNDLGALETAGDSLPKASYVHLDHGYWIEKVLLTPQGAHVRKRTTVTQTALAYAQWAYWVAETHRQVTGITTQVMGRQQQLQTALPQGQMPRDLSSSPAFPVTTGVSQGALWIDQPSAKPYSLGKDAVSWRSGGNLPKVGGVEGRASWRDHHAASPGAVPYAVGKSQASWRRGS